MSCRLTFLPIFFGTLSHRKDDTQHLDALLLLIPDACALAKSLYAEKEAAHGSLEEVRKLQSDSESQWLGKFECLRAQLEEEIASLRAGLAGVREAKEGVEKECQQLVLQQRTTSLARATAEQALETLSREHSQVLGFVLLS